MNLPTEMRAVVLTGHGGPEMLEFREDVPVPTPAGEEVIVAVTACGMNNTDINTRVGWYSKTGSDHDGSWGGSVTFPRIQGADPVGRIVATGDAVAATRVGERVLIDAWKRETVGEPPEASYLGSEYDGGYAEYVAVPAENAHAINSTLTDVELASFPCSYATAEHMLHRVGLSRNEWILVSGASGGVGAALVQLAKRRGSRVVALTSAAKLEDVRSVGADVVLDRSMSGLDEAVLADTDGVHVFADVVGGDTFPKLFETIRRRGRYVTAGAVGGPIVQLDLRTLYLRDITMHGATVLPSEVFENLVGYIERGEVRPLVAATYPLELMADAQSRFLEKNHVGSIVIEVAANEIGSE